MKMKRALILNLWFAAILVNAALITVPYQGMHAFEISGVPVGYMPFFFCLVVFIMFSKFRISKREFTIIFPLLGIIVYGVLSVLWIVDYKSWFIYFMMWSFYIISFLFSSYFIFKYLTLNDIISFIRKMLFVCSIISIVGLFRFFILNFPDTNPWPLINRNGYIFFAVPIIPLLFALRDHGSLGIKPFLMILLLVLTNIILTFSRMGFIGLCVSIFGYLLFTMVNNGTLIKRTGRIFTFVFVFLFMSIFVSIPHFREKLYSTFTTVISIREIGEVQTGELDYRRFVLISEAVRIFKEHWLLGTGMGLSNYLTYFEGNTIPAKPHSLYLSYLAEFGLIGFTFSFLFLIFLTIDLYKTLKLTKNLKESFIAKGFFIGHISILTMFIFNEYITSPFVWFYWAMAMGFSLICTTIIQKKIGRLNE